MNHSDGHLLDGSGTLCGLGYLELNSLVNDADSLCLPVRFLESVSCTGSITEHTSFCNPGSIILGHGVLILALAFPLNTRYTPAHKEDELCLCRSVDDTHSRGVVVFTDLMDAITAFRFWTCSGGSQAFYQLEMLGGSHSALFHIRETSKSVVEENWLQRAEEIIGAPVQTCLRESIDVVQSTFAWDKIRDAALRRSSPILNSVSPLRDKMSRHENSSADWSLLISCPIQFNENKSNDTNFDGRDHARQCLFCNALTSYISILHEEHDVRNSIVQLRSSHFVEVAMNKQTSDVGNIASMSISLRNSTPALENSIAQEVIALLAEEESTARMKLSKFLSSQSSAS